MPVRIPKGKSEIRHAWFTRRAHAGEVVYPPGTIVDLSDRRDYQLFLLYEGEAVMERARNRAHASGSDEPVIEARHLDLDTGPQVTVSEPKLQGPKPRIWKDGGLVEVDNAIAVFQDVFITADVSPAPTTPPSLGPASLA